ncbi:hypothetical protein QBC35DRAFT_472977 [Podospora australis]|uniref:C2H2-type domain-containing protein n=1 Tax=Podospora australis TaxID=1536484 RepID=A0AAN6WZ57_9PEZI|nr:hypothetical protein QBC35DRAFT_472977 [Podospora australis]
MMYNYGIPFSPYEAADLEVASSGLYHGSLEKTSMARASPVVDSASGSHKCPAPLCDERFQELHVLQSMLNELGQNLKDLRESKCVECSHARQLPSSSRSPCQSGKWCRTKSGLENVIGSMFGSVKRALSSGKHRSSRKAQIQQPNDDWPSASHPVSTEHMWEKRFSDNVCSNVGSRPELSATEKSQALLRAELPVLGASPPSYDSTIGRQQRMQRPVITTRAPVAELDISEKPPAELDSSYHRHSVHLAPSYPAPPSKSYTGISIGSQYSSQSQSSSFGVVSPWSSLCTNSTSTSSFTAPSSVDSGFGQFTASPDAYGPSEKLPWDVQHEPSKQGSFVSETRPVELPGNSVALGNGAPAAAYPGLSGSFSMVLPSNTEASSFQPTVFSRPQESGVLAPSHLQGLPAHLDSSCAPFQHADFVTAVPDHTAVAAWDDEVIGCLESFSQENTLIGFEGLDSAWLAEDTSIVPKAPLAYFPQATWEPMTTAIANPILPAPLPVEEPDAEQPLVHTAPPDFLAVPGPGQGPPMSERRDSVCCRPCRFFPEDGPDQRKKIARHKRTARHCKTTGQEPEMANSFQCHTCRKIYNRRDNLTQHVKVHSAENMGVRPDVEGIQLLREAANSGLQRRDAKRRPIQDVKKTRR